MDSVALTTERLVLRPRRRATSMRSPPPARTRRSGAGPRCRARMHARTPRSSCVSSRGGGPTARGRLGDVRRRPARGHDRSAQHRRPLHGRRRRARLLGDGRRPGPGISHGGRPRGARLGLRRTRARPHPLAGRRREHPSARAARALGFRYEGLQRQALTSPRGRDDGWMAALLPDDDRTPVDWPVL